MDKTSKSAISDSPALLEVVAQLTDLLDDGVFWVDPAERIRYWNRSLARLSDLPVDVERATVGETLLALLPDEAKRDRLLEAIRCRLAGGSANKTRLEAMPLTTRGGAVRQVEFEILPLRFAAASPASPPASAEGGVLVVAHDETRRFTAQNDLEILLHSSSDGIFVISRQGQITMFNDACESITGYRREEVLYQSGACQKIFQCYKDQGDMVHQPICPGHNVFESDAPVSSTEQVIHTRDGRRRWVECSYSPIHGPDGKALYVIVIVRDITERKRLEEQLRVSQRLATLGELVGGLAHEIRNPLGIIRSAADIVANEKRPAPQRREAAQFIKDEAARLDRTVKSLLSLARPAHGDATPLDLNDVLEKTIAFYAPQREGFTIQTRFGEDLPKVRACRDALQSVFFNLILNADEAMSKGGTLHVDTARDDGGARIVFRDEGPGIDPDVLDRIFLPFVTTKRSGIGLGLSLAAHVVEAHNGQIAVENHPEGGACFTILLPGCSEEQR